MSVQDCEYLIDHILPREFQGSEHTTLIRTSPEPILEDDKVQLWAQSKAGRYIWVNMLGPQLRAYLKQVAALGIGYSGRHEDVSYVFVQSRSQTLATWLPSHSC